MLGVQIGAQGVVVSATSAQQQAARKVTRMCVIIATTFSVAWLPYQLTRMVITYGNDDQAWFARTVYAPTSALSYVNSCINPIVYGLMWRPFRVSLIQVTPSCVRVIMALISLISDSMAYSKQQKNEKVTTI